MRTITLATVAALMLTGCQTANKSGGPLLISTAETVSLQPGEADVIAMDLAGMLEQHFAPGKTTFTLQKPASGVLGPVLEGKLRDAGYGVGVDPAQATGDAVEIAYLVDRYDQSYVVRVQAGQGYEVSRLYRNRDGNFMPASGFSLRNGGDVQ